MKIFQSLKTFLAAVFRRCSVKKVFLQILQNSLDNTFARVSFDKVAVLATPIKNMLLRPLIVQNTRERVCFRILFVLIYRFLISKYYPRKHMTSSERLMYVQVTSCVYGDHYYQQILFKDTVMQILYQQICDRFNTNNKH